jgi:hypothetical protein
MLIHPPLHVIYASSKKVVSHTKTRLKKQYVNLKRMTHALEVTVQQVCR